MEPEVISEKIQKNIFFFLGFILILTGLRILPNSSIDIFYQYNYLFAYITCFSILVSFLLRPLAKSLGKRLKISRGIWVLSFGLSFLLICLYKEVDLSFEFKKYNKAVEKFSELSQGNQDKSIHLSTSEYGEYSKIINFYFNENQKFLNEYNKIDGKANAINIDLSRLLENLMCYSEIIRAIDSLDFLNTIIENKRAKFEEFYVCCQDKLGGLAQSKAEKRFVEDVLTCAFSSNDLIEEQFQLEKSYISEQKKLFNFLARVYHNFSCDGEGIFFEYEEEHRIFNEHFDHLEQIEKSLEALYEKMSQTI